MLATEVAVIPTVISIDNGSPTYVTKPFSTVTNVLFELQVTAVFWVPVTETSNWICGFVAAVSISLGPEIETTIVSTTVELLTGVVVEELPPVLLDVLVELELLLLLPQPVKIKLPRAATAKILIFHDFSPFIWLIIYLMFEGVLNT